MTGLAYRQTFADIQPTALSAVVQLRQPVHQQRELQLNEEQHHQLAMHIANVEKGGVSILVLVEFSQSDIALLANQLCEALHKALWLVNCQGLQKEYIGETEKNIARLIADAQRQHTMLIFDHASHLFNPRNLAGYAHLDIDLLIKFCHQQAGSYVLNLSQQDSNSLIALKARGLPIFSHLIR